MTKEYPIEALEQKLDQVVKETEERLKEVPVQLEMEWDDFVQQLKNFLGEDTIVSLVPAPPK